MTRSVDLPRCVVRDVAVAALCTFPSLLGAQQADRPRLLGASSQSTTAEASGPAPARAIVASIAIEGGARRVLVGATVPHVGRVRDAAGVERRDVAIQWTSSNPIIASVNQFGVLTAVRPGPVTVRAVAGALSAERKYTVETNPIKSLTLSITADRARTGDVIEVAATAFDASGNKVANIPFLYTFTAAVEDSVVGQLAPASLDQKGRFVAQKAGDYQIIAVAPGLVAHRTIRVSNRAVVEPARLTARVGLGGGTWDVRAWRGRDGRQYALACAGGARGHVMSFALGEATLEALDTLSVDARSVVDCAVDDDGLAVIVRENANGRASLAVIDASDPRALKLRGVLDDGLGAVSGIGMARRHVFVASDARRLDVVSLDDPARPRRVGSIDLAPESDAAADGEATDVSVTDGIAYVALGRRGVAIVDVGNGKFGGALAKPVRIGSFRPPFTSTHAAYGYRSRTGKWYVITSEDLGRPRDGGRTGVPASGTQSGFARIIDFTDPVRPEDVARYEVPEAGVHDLWVEGERLYVAAQTGGLRVVDISEDLKGNLYHQGREIARLAAIDSGAVPNVFRVQPTPAGVLVGDRGSGILMVRVGHP